MMQFEAMSCYFSLKVKKVEYDLQNFILEKNFAFSFQMLRILLISKLLKREL
jgi:hypothetical protein